MLRLGFLPSDFNPMVLMLGEPEDLRCLAGVLRQFARTGGNVALHELAFCAAPRTRLTLVGADAESGVRPAAGAADHLLWRLDSARAARFADMVEDLAAPARLAGSALLACGAREEIPVKVSRGEYTDDFLLGAARSVAGGR